MRLYRTAAALFVAAAALLSAVSAAPPEVGRSAPDFELRSIDGRTVRLSQIAASGPTVLIALRGYPGYQCPVCNRQVHDFLSRADDFAAANARVVMVYPGPAADLERRAREFAADKPFPARFTLLLDPDYEFTNLYGLRWDAPNETAYPATFILTPDLRVTYRLVSRTHGGRSKAADILKELGR